MSLETSGAPTGRQDLKQMLEQYERDLIRQALAGAGGHQRRAAAILGILPTTLHEKMKRLGIPTRTSAAREQAGAGSQDGIQAA